MSPEQQSQTPKVTISNETPSEPSRIGKLKLAFLYVLIGGLAASALTAIIALLIGSFNSEIQKSLLTIFIFFTHSLFILALLWSDKFNQVGRALLPTTIFALALADMITTTLATWEIITAETAWRALGLYMLIIGAVFIIIGIQKLRVKHQPTLIGLYVTTGAIAAVTLVLAPWVLQVVNSFDPLYYRVIAALAIFASTSFLITVILRSIALARHTELKTTKPTSQPIPGGLLAIYITVGSIAAMVWSAGFSGFIISAVESGQPTRSESRNRYY